MKRIQTQEEKDAIKAKAKATKEAMKTPNAIATAAEFAPAWKALETEQRHIVVEAGLIVANMVEALEIDATADGKTRLMKMVAFCTDSSYLRQIGGQWAGVVLGSNGDSTTVLGEVKIGKENGVDVVKTLNMGNISTFKELAIAAKAGNALIGVAPRGRSKEQIQASKAAKLGDDVWTALETVIKSEAGIARMRKFLNDHGYEMTARMKAETVNLPQAAMERVSRKMRKVA